MAQLMDIKVKPQSIEIDEDEGLDEVEIKIIQIERLQKKINDLEQTLDRLKINFTEQLELSQNSNKVLTKQCQYLRK